MRKEYVTPIATEETFEANEYIASCSWNITSSAGNNRMQCANPKHSDFMNGSYFTSVWVEATNSTCKIKVSKQGIGKTAILNGNNARPAHNATVYGETGTTYTCSTSYYKKSDRYTYNVPDFGGTNGSSTPHYGTYVNTGSYDEIMEKVFS